MKLVANEMAISIVSEMINNERELNRRKVLNKSVEEIKQDCEINASKRLIAKFRERYPRLPARIIGDSLYPSIGLIEMCEEKI